MCPASIFNARRLDLQYEERSMDVKEDDIASPQRRWYCSAMATQFQISASQIRDFQVIRDLKTGVLSSIAKHLNALDSVLLNPADLFSSIKNFLDGLDCDECVAECVMRQSLTLNGLMLQTGLNADDVLTGVRSGIERDAGWTTEEVEKWGEVEPKFHKLLCSNAFRIVATTIDLSYEYANLYRNARILTDIRPLFTEDANEIEGAVVSFTLRLRFESVEGSRELNIAMDEGDIEDLSVQCGRALKKSQTARKTMTEKAGIPTVLSGERDNA